MASNGVSVVPFVEIAILYWRLKGLGQKLHGGEAAHVAEQAAPSPHVLGTGWNTKVAQCAFFVCGHMHVPAHRGVYEEAQDELQVCYDYRLLELRDRSDPFRKSEILVLCEALVGILVPRCYSCLKTL